ncbi:MAG: hypothetical protein SPJ99_08405 [Candidatus Coprenecus sp.]|nr:hypothetical protein [Candidatus Coprenecus sp.]
MGPVYKIGLIGYPIKGSASPALFRKYSLERGGDALSFVYELIETEYFDEAVRIFLADYCAVNVTAPFKKMACGVADILSDEVKAAGATNLLVRTSSGIKAYNTDYLALRDILAGSSGKVAVIGTGGAGHAAASAARSLGMETVLVNRTPAEGVYPLSQIDMAVKDCSCVVYTLPVHLPSLPELVRGKRVIEANYKTPLFTQQICSQYNIDYVSGMVWLEKQGYHAYSIIMNEALRSAR